MSTTLIIPILTGIAGQMALAWVLDFRRYAPAFIAADSMAFAVYVAAVAITA